MKIVQWILTVIALLFSLLTLFAAFQGTVFSLIFALLALVIIAPPLYPQINKRLPFLRFSFLKIFLCVLLWFVALGFIGGNTVSFANAAVCASPGSETCGKSEIAFLETTSSLTVSADLTDPGDAGELKEVGITMDYWAQPDQESEVYSETFEVPQDKQQMLFTLEELNLQPGSYRVNITPVLKTDKTALTKEVQFAVWTSTEDVEKRNSGELENAGLFHNSISEVNICEHSGQRGTFCQQDMPEISSGAAALGFTAEIPNLRIRRASVRGDSQITFVLRILSVPGEELTEPEEMFRETQELEGDVGTYTLINTPPEGGLPQGLFELVTFLEAKDSLPIRKVFTIK
ncbi:MAG: hypothetical protein AAF685_00330 [Cyanobacteria bacterium P01_C01_bin.89]